MKTTAFSFLTVILALTCPGGDRAAGQKHFVQLKCSLAPIAIETIHHRADPRIRNTDGSSLNWGGYAVETNLKKPQKGSVDSVAGQWLEPNVSASSSASTYSAFWVGIDGDSSSSVEQLGTEGDWTPGGEQHYAWFEMYPKAGFTITGFPVAPGDQIGAGVRHSGNGQFVLAITNYTAGVYFVVPANYSRSRSAACSSAEWIVEAPFAGGVLPLADFGTIPFAECRTEVNGVSGSILNPGWQFEAITMQTQSGTAKAIPSPLSQDGTSFSVRWRHE